MNYMNSGLSSTKSVIYFDCNATTPMAEEVIKGINNSLINDWGNPCSMHLFGAKAKVAIGKARNEIADMLNCAPNNVIFTSGGTESNNIIINSAIQYFNDQKNIKLRFADKPHIITTSVEHDSILLPLKHLEENSVITCTIVDANNEGCIKVEDLLSKIKEQTCLITVMYANNETGVIMPIEIIGNLLAEINFERKEKDLSEILFHSDAAQIIGKEVVDFQAANLDYLTVVGHKFYGPRIGCVIAKKILYPFFFGGGQENGLRPGTENTPMIVGLGIAAQLVRENVRKYKAQMLKCRDKLESRLKETFGDEIVINCEKSNRLCNTTNISFKKSGFKGNYVLSRCSILIAGVGAACHVGPQHSQVLINSGVPLNLAQNAIRLSLGRYTTLQDVERVVIDLETAIKKLKALNI